MREIVSTLLLSVALGAGLGACDKVLGIEELSGEGTVKVSDANRGQIDAFGPQQIDASQPTVDAMGPMIDAIPLGVPDAVPGLPTDNDSEANEDLPAPGSLPK